MAAVPRQLVADFQRLNHVGFTPARGRIKCGMRSFLGLIGLLWLAPVLLAQNGTMRVLFLGNSLTAGNDVPGLVRALAHLQGVTLTYDERSPGGVSLEDHWNFGHGQLLQQAAFDVVVLQQGPSTLPESQSNLRTWAMTWADFARAQGATPALYMVWPHTWQSNGFTLVSQSYRNAAGAAGAAVFPAGEAWEAALAASPGLQLYSDDLHGNQAGSLLAAMVIGRGLFSLDPALVPAQIGGRYSVSQSTLAVFRQVVSSLPASTLTATHRPGTDGTPSPSPSPGPAPAPAPRAGGGGSTSLVFVVFAALFSILRVKGAAKPVLPPGTDRAA